jgi:hypothetical protein
MTIKNAFDFGDTVYLATDPEQFPRMVTGLIVRPHGVLYFVSCNTEETTHYDFELSLEKNIMASLGINETKQAQ